MTPVHYRQGAFPPTERLDWQRLAPALASASLALGRYDNALVEMPNSNLLLSVFARREADFSSRIEGTQVSMEQVMRFEAGEIPGTSREREDIEEVINYQRATDLARKLLANQALSLEIILEVHQILLSGTRGQNRNPGSFRANQNWIGTRGGTIHDARYIPVRIGRMYEALDTWLSYTLNDPSVPLVKVALMHAEFEAIHPFGDGNGRLGRMLIPLMMWQYGLISEPLFNVSAYLESMREEYIDRLQAVSGDDDWTGWCKFFLQTVTSQAGEDLAKMRKVTSLYDGLKIRIAEIGRSKYGIAILDGIFSRPIFTTSSIVVETRVPVRAARRILGRFRDHEILKELKPGTGQSPSVFLFTDLLEIAEGKAAPQ
ncbi:MAG: Fic family protein [Anaerolineaceae bacterium]|nr:Fic family protein [Anaerolineaceae bacterium]MDE0328912.1 Fic family protein [Anaerolineaceae bacterium]